MTTPSNKSSIISAFKAYLFPSLVTIIGMLIWRDVTEMRSDIKMLLAQSNIDKTRIENLQLDVNKLENAVFNKRTANADRHIPLFMKLYFKPEEEFDIKKHIKFVQYES